MGVKELTRERQPQGEVTRLVDARKNSQLFGLAVALEDTNWLQNDDKRRTYAFVDKATRRIELSRMLQCSWVNIACKLRRREVQQRIDAIDLAP